MGSALLIEPRTMGLVRWRGCCIWIAFFTLGIMAVALPVMDYFRAVPGDLIDGRFNSIVLEHLYLWTKGLEPGLWSPGFFYPYPGALTFSDNHFGSGVLYVLLRYLDFDREHAFDGWYLASYVLNFAACFHALRRFGYGALASACGAFVFAFALPVTANNIHAQLGFRFAVPLAMASFHDLLERRDLKHFGYLAAWVALEFYCSIYIGFFLIFLLMAYIAATLVPWKVQDVRVAGLWSELRGAYRQASRRDAVMTFAFVVLSLAAMAALLYPYAHYSKLYGFVRPVAEVASMQPRWKSYFLADGSLLWHGVSARLGDIPIRHEHQMFLGIGVVLLVLSGIGYRRDRWAMASFVALGLLVLVTMKFPHFSIYSKLFKIPGLNAIRAVARIILVMLFPVSVLVARAIERSLRSGRRIGLAVAVAIGVLIMLVECVAVASYKTPIREWRDRLALYQGELPDKLPSNAIVFVPVSNPNDFMLPEIDSVILAQDRGVMSLNGYSGNNPSSYRPDFNDPCNEIRLRVSGYAAFAQLPQRDHQALLGRIVSVGSPKCHPGRVE